MLGQNRHNYHHINPQVMKKNAFNNISLFFTYYPHKSSKYGSDYYKLNTKHLIKRKLNLLFLSILKLSN